MTNTREDGLMAVGEAGSTAMTAVVRERYGEAEDVLRLAQVDRPELQPDEVLVRVGAAGLDRGVWHLMAGLPYPVRLAGFGLRAPKDVRIGSEVAGRVEAVGTGATSLRVGDEVFGIATGSFAEYAKTRETNLARKPSNLSFEQAAAVPVSATTALQAVRDRAHVQPGQRVLVIGASGGVGTFAVQIAKAFGAEVTGVCSTSKLDLVRSLGADHVIDYRVDELSTGEARYDAILDTGGNRPLGQLRRLLTPRGTLVIIGAETGGRWLGGTDRQLRAMVLSPFIGQTLGTFIASTNSADLTALAKLIEAGKVTPVVDRSYPLSEVPQAIRYMQEGRARGKVSISVDPAMH